MLTPFRVLRETPPFGVSAIEGFLTIESLLQDAIQYVPHCDEHRDVWSPKFATIILESAIHIDSLWKASALIDDPISGKRQLTIIDHRQRFGDYVKQQPVVSFGGAAPIVIRPFNVWNKTSFESPPWWIAYNKLKHDRFTHQNIATLDHAVHATAALLLAIVYSGKCDMAILSADLFSPSNPWAHTDTGMLRDIEFSSLAKVESRLLGHPIGVSHAIPGSLSAHWESESARFNLWWATYMEPSLNSTP